MAHSGCRYRRGWRGRGHPEGGQDRQGGREERVGNGEDKERSEKRKMEREEQNTLAIQEERVSHIMSMMIRVLEDGDRMTDQEGTCQCCISAQGRHRPPSVSAPSCRCCRNRSGGDPGQGMAVRYLGAGARVQVHGSLQTWWRGSVLVARLGQVTVFLHPAEGPVQVEEGAAGVGEVRVGGREGLPGVH